MPTLPDVADRDLKPENPIECERPVAPTWEPPGDNSRRRFGGSAKAYNAQRRRRLR